MKKIHRLRETERERKILKDEKRQRNRQTAVDRPIQREQILRQKETETERQRQKDGKLQTVESAIRNSGLNLFVIAMSSQGNYCNDETDTLSNKGRERKKQIERWKKTKNQKDRMTERQTKRERTDTETK